MTELPARPPVHDDVALMDTLGHKGYHDDVLLSQYPAWGEHTGLFKALFELGEADSDTLVNRTELTQAGVEAIGGVLVCMNLLERRGDRLALSALSREYLVPGEPYYLGDSIYLNCRRRLSNNFVKEGSPLAESSSTLPVRMWNRFLKRWRGWDWGGRRILANQHSRNLPAGVAAAQLPLFDNARCVVDIAGGTGTFSMPLARRLPQTRVILTDLPQALRGARRFLQTHGLDQRIELLGMDVFETPWPIPTCDVVFFGNFAHGFTDAQCLEMARNSHESLEPGGILVWHELTWNDSRDGPLKAALWNVTMQDFGGSQRTIAAWHHLLEQAGFERLFAHRTSGGFYAIGGHRPG